MAKEKKKSLIKMYHLLDLTLGYYTFTKVQEQRTETQVNSTVLEELVRFDVTRLEHQGCTS